MSIRQPSSIVELDYIVIGHATRDLINDDFTVGGTVCYSARTARALDCRVGVVTSVDPDLDLSQALDDILVTRYPAATTTTFENTYTPTGRRQVLHSLAETLTPNMLPAHWKTTPDSGIIHVGPIAWECDSALAGAFGHAFVGVTPQGWMRRWDQAGCVSSGPWEQAELWLTRADAVVLSDEDVGGDQSLLAQYASQTRLLVVTHEMTGCTVHTQGQTRSFPAPSTREIDATGAGDIFAAAFFVALQRCGDPWTAARFANCIAANSVTRMGLDSTPTLDEVARCEQILGPR